MASLCNIFLFSHYIPGSYNMAIMRVENDIFLFVQVY